LPSGGADDDGVGQLLRANPGAPARVPAGMGGDRPGLELIAEFDTEIQMFERWGHTSSYEFFVARRPLG